MDFLNNITTQLTDNFGPLGPLLAVGLLGLALMVAVLPMLLQKKPEPFDKLKALRREIETASTAKKGASLRHNEKADKLQKFASFLEPQDEEAMSASRLKMMRAGYKQKNAVRTFHFAQMTLGVGLLVLGLLYTLASKGDAEVSTQVMILSTLLPGGLGYYFPMYWVNSRVQKRQAEIVSGFPDALDLMLVCVEAGQSLDQSINRIAKESRASCPALAEEFDTVAQEVKAGKERVKVLKDMSERVGIADISSFCTTLVQSASFGTSMSDALRVYSAEMRDKRIMRAEEMANKLPTKLTLGTMLFTLPPLLIILIGPSIYGISKTVGGG
ncbi:pilus assembly protein TadC [Cypionkella aquatica]|uniref:Pilus assembly protein TadC n=1 Tax=Cypionkella aquatica TaxID=1756042 RepID=A0AA37U780_9RHOB|nr:type II secretion system F family protein [Cypionkella aquatica]GLS86801.1 pilus assembly protein TadC [Cypionkella aquatica]